MRRAVSDSIVDYSHDGSIYDRTRDPPGQRSVYIPPGDATRESYRLRTFKDFPQDVPVSPSSLAAAGFYYTGYKDRVRCFCCGTCVEDWVAEDDVTSSRWHTSDCKIMLKQECGNVSLLPESSSLARIQLAEELFPPFPLLHSPQHNFQPLFSNMISFSGIPRLQQLNPQVERIPPGDEKREAYRLSTFNRFPYDSPVPRDVLSAAGFLYTGIRDKVRCFSCNSCVEGWAVNDAFGLIFGLRPRLPTEWHRPDCRMKLSQECGNTPLGFSRAIPDSTSRSRPQERSHHLQSSNPANPHMADVDARCGTFDSQWPQHRVQAPPRQLAEAGFFFLGERDKVKCFHCNGNLQDWEPNDDPWKEHAKWFPTCEYLLQSKGPNFVHSVASAYPNLSRPRIAGQVDEQPLLNDVQQPQVPTTTKPQLQRPQVLTTVNPQERRHQHPCLTPTHPHMTNEDARCETFDDRWPQGDISATPRQLAEAGFFFLGERDRVKCFHCGGKFENWKWEDDPWKQHAKRFPTCEHLLRSKGRDFVHSVTNPFPNFRGPQTADQRDGQPLNDAQQPQIPLPATADSQERNTLFPCHHPVNPHMTNEDARRETFNNRWSQDAIDTPPRQLAEAGLFFLGERHIVKCFYCDGVLQNLKRNDDPWVEHAKKFPTCEFLLRSKGPDFVRSVANELPNVSRPVAASQDDGQLRRDTQNSSFLRFFVDDLQAELNLESQSMRENRRQFPCRDPVNPHMSDENARLVTFGDRWPQRLVNATPSQVSKAGFFYCGDGDKAQCWYCNGGVQNWGLEDDPWTEHAKWFPTCEFMLQQMGICFVRNVLSLFPDLDRLAVTNGYNGPLLESFRPFLSRLPPPPVTAPRTDLNAEVEAAMSSVVTEAALEFGYPLENVKKRIKMKLEREHSMYGSVAALIEDLQADEEQERFVEQRPSAVETETAIRAMEDVLRISDSTIQELEDERRCKICFDADAAVAFIPCGHLCCCVRCANGLTSCPICRVAIQECLRVSMA